MTTHIGPEESTTARKSADKAQDYILDAALIARYAKALGHPARIRILQFLADREECYFGDINDELPIAKATVSQHLKELKGAGLIRGTIEAPKVRYCIDRENWQYARKLFAEFFSSEIKDNHCGCGSCRQHGTKA